MAKIEDGKGKSGDASVSATQRLNVSAKIAGREFYSSRDDGLAFIAVYDGITAAANDLVAYLKNTSDTRNMMVGPITMGGVEAIKWKMFSVSGAAAAGETVIASNCNLSSNRTPEAVIMAGDTAITGLTTLSQFFSRRSPALQTIETEFGRALILGPNTAIAVEYDTGTGGLCELEIHFHYENLDHS